MNTASGYHAVILLRDDFDGTSLDPEKWQCRDVNNSRVSGITQFRDCPDVNNGFLTITHHTYNPYEPNQTCLSQEIFTKARYEPNNALEFTARIRLRPPIGNGLVAGFYVYMDKPISESDPNLINDEIDFEFLTNQINNPYPAFLGDRVFTAVYNDFDQSWMNHLKHWWDNPTVPKIIIEERPQLDLTQFNIFKIRWLGDRVEWYWDPNDGKGDILIYKTSNVLPDEAMALYLNFWASDELWGIAWDENLKPAAGPKDDAVSFLDFDFVEVSYILPDECDQVWALGYGLTTDYNADCKVNLFDFAQFANDWLKCYDPNTINCN
jgi:beta-glucanase (GH16 family)